MVGNDIVDLQFFESPRYRHIRYLDRVCLPAEAAAVRRSESPVRKLAIIWASKEAAFKLISRGRCLRHFVPRDFLTDFRASEAAAEPLNGVVWYGGERLATQLAMCDGWVHATATNSSSVDVRWRVTQIAPFVNSAAVAGDESEAAREIAQSLFDELGFASASWSGQASTPLAPFSVAADRHEIAVSLSHHGAYAAAAVAWSSNDSLPAGSQGNGWGE